jgi:hypothetical protein
MKKGLLKAVNFTPKSDVDKFLEDSSFNNWILYQMNYGFLIDIVLIDTKPKLKFLILVQKLSSYLGG